MKIAMRVKLTGLFMIFASSAFADRPIPSPFPGLKTFTIAVASLESYSPPQQISFDPAISKLLNARLNVEFNSQGIGGIELTRVLLTKIDRTKGDRYYIDFDPGASNDPVFAVVPEGRQSVIGTIDADHLVVPGNGFLYALARTNRNFLERRKYFIEGAKIIEAKQPFLYVGLETKANKSFSLYSTQSSSEIVASVRKGDRIQVVLNEGDFYLIRTTFGLLGWAKIDVGFQEGDAVEGIFYAGD